MDEGTLSKSQTFMMGLSIDQFGDQKFRWGDANYLFLIY